MAHIHEKIDFTVAIFVVQRARCCSFTTASSNKWLPLGGHIELDEDPETGRVARGQRGERAGGRIAWRASAHDRARHPRPDRPALSGHPSHHRHARAHRHDLLGAAEERRADARCRRASRHPLVFRRGLGQPAAADERRREVVLPQGASEGVSGAGCQGSRFDSASRITHHVNHAPPCIPGSSRPAYFVLEGLNSFATTYYFYYFYFFMQTEFGFRQQGQLVLAALNGLVYAPGLACGGTICPALWLFHCAQDGFRIMIVALAVGSQFS